MNMATSPHPPTTTDNLILPGVIGATVEGPRTPIRTRMNSSNSFQSPRSPRSPLRPISRPGRGSYVDEVVQVVREPYYESRGGSPPNRSAQWRKKYRPHDTPIASEKLPRNRTFSFEEDEREDEDEISSWAGGASPTPRSRGVVELALDSGSVHREGEATLEQQEDEEYQQDQEPELTQAQLDAEEAERIRELDQLGSIKRIARSLQSLGTPNKNASRSVSDGEDSDSGASAISVRTRARHDVYLSHRQARQARIPPLHNLSKSLSTEREVPSIPRSQRLPGTPTLRNLDSGVAMMSQDGYEDRYEDNYIEDRVVTSQENPGLVVDYRYDVYPRLERLSTPRRGSPHLPVENVYPHLTDSRSEYESLEEDILDHEAEPVYRSGSPSSTKDLYEVDSKPLRQHRQPKRIYPWHVVWRGLAYYTQELMELYNTIVNACVSFLWFMLDCIRVSLTWPWTQRHKVHQITREWYETGVAVGLLSPGALFGVALLAFVVLGGKRSNGEISQEQSWNGQGEHADSALNNTRPTDSRSSILNTFGRAWDVVTWRSEGRVKSESKSKIRWSDWVPRLPSLDLWVPSKKTDREPFKIQIPEGDIKSLEELEARIGWIQKTLKDLLLTDGELAESLKNLEDDVRDKLAKEGSHLQDLVRRVDHMVEKERLTHGLERRFDDESAKRDMQVDEIGRRFHHEVTEREKQVGDLERRIQLKIAEKDRQAGELQNFIETKLHETDARVEDMTVWIGGLEHKLQRVADDVTTLKKYISDGRWIELKVLEIFRDQIPRYLVVSKDPESGKLSIPASFWDSARELFMTSDQVQKSIDEKLSELKRDSGDTGSDADDSMTGGWGWGFKDSKNNKKKAGQSMTWDDFLSENRVPISNYIDGRITTVSRGEFLNLVRTEATQIWKGLEKNVVALLEKQGKLKGRAPPHQSASTGVFGNDKELTDVERDLVNSLIDEALNKYSADVLAKADYALHSAGGRIIPRLTSADYEHGQLPGYFRRVGATLFSLPHRQKSSETAIKPDVHVGECWAMKGQRGQLAVRLARPIIVTEVTIEHADPSIVLESGSAPREIEIWSLTTDTDAAPTSRHRPRTSTTSDKNDKSESADESAESSTEPSATTGSTGDKEPGFAWNMLEGSPWHGSRLLTTVVYDTSSGLGSEGTFLGEVGDAATEPVSNQKSKARQTFSIPLSKQTEPSQGIVFRIKSNWGNPDLTCVYRVRVHGYEQL